MFHDSCTSWRLLARQIRSHLLDIEQLSDENPSQSGSLGLPILDLDIKVVSDKSLISHQSGDVEESFFHVLVISGSTKHFIDESLSSVLSKLSLVVVLQISDELLPLVDNVLHVSEIPFPL